MNHLQRPIDGNLIVPRSPLVSVTGICYCQNRKTAVREVSAKPPWVWV